MNLRQLEIFHAVMRHQTTVAAARELVISQPAVSNAIKHLESQLGFRLFDRVGNRLVPREEAKALFRDAEPIFLLTQAIGQTVRDLRENRAGHVRLAATPPIGHTLMPNALRRFLATRPDVKVFFDVGRSERVIEAVETTVADFGVAVGLESDLSHLFEIVTIGKARMVCVLPMGHELSAKEIVTPADLRGRCLIGLEFGTPLGTRVRAAFRVASEPYKTAVDVRYCHTACLLTQAGIGVAVVDEFSARSQEGKPLLVRRFEPQIDVEARAIFLKNRPLSRLARALLEELQAEAGSY